MTVKDVYYSLFYRTEVTIRTFGEINNENDAINNYTDTIATKDNIDDFKDLTIMCIVATDENKVLIEVA